MVKFRASGVGNLLVGGNSITDKQREKLQELIDRQHDPNAKPLTVKMHEEMAALIEKRDAPYEFGATARSHIRELWLKNEHDYEEVVVSKEIIKGYLCEQEAIDVVSRQVPGGTRVKNIQSYENDWFTGTPDIVLDDAIEDVKCSWSKKTYSEVEHPSALYYAQGQAYMDITGRDVFRLCHVLLPTPYEMVTEEQSRIYYQFACNEEDQNYVEAYNRLARNHDVSAIPEPQRIKIFEFRREDMYLAKLRKRVEQAQAVYDSMSL